MNVPRVIVWLVSKARRTWWRARALARSVGASCCACGAPLTFRQWFGVVGGKACRACVLRLLDDVRAHAERSPVIDRPLRCFYCRRSLPAFFYGDPRQGAHSGVCQRCQALRDCTEGRHLYAFGPRCFWCNQPQRPTS